MKLNEKRIIMKQYAMILDLISQGFDKFDTKTEFSVLMRNLGLEKERIIVENEHFIKENCLNFIAEDTYATLNNIVRQYNNDEIVEYDIILSFVEELKYEMSEEHRKNVEACLRILENQN